MNGMTFEVSIPTEFLPDLSIIIRLQAELDAAVMGFDPEAVELRSDWLAALLEVC